MTLTEGLLIIIAGQLFLVLQKMLTQEDWKEVYKLGGILLVIYVVASYWQVILAAILFIISAIADIFI